MKSSKFLILLSFVLILGITQQGYSELKAGIGVVDISGDSAIVIDPLHVKAIVFRNEVNEVVLVECDVTSVSTEVAHSARKLASEKTGIPFANICIAATHTHMSTPHKELVPNIVKAIVKAHDTAKPVKLKSGHGQEFTVSFNRRYFMKDGSVMFNPMFLNPDIVCPAGPIDPEVGIMMIYNASNDHPIASLINFALHLDTVKEYGTVYQNTGVGSRESITADYPYWIEESLRSDFGTNFVSVFTTGCCANINHWDFSRPGPQSGHKTKTKHIGESLAAAIKTKLPDLKEAKPSLAVRSRVLQVPLQNYTDKDLKWAKQMQNAGLSSKSEETSERQSFLDRVRMRRILWLAERTTRSIPLDLQVFRISDEIAIVTLPGEMFVELGLMIKNLSPFENTFLITLANNNIAYVPNRKAFLQGGYEVENSRLAPGGGEMIVQAAVQMLKELKSDSY